MVYKTYRIGISGVPYFFAVFCKKMEIGLRLWYDNKYES